MNEMDERIMRTSALMLFGFLYVFKRRLEASGATGTDAVGGVLAQAMEEWKSSVGETWGEAA
jgi:hypothetical protein